MISLFRRHPSATPDASGASDVAGSRCTVHGCSNVTTVPCVYRDRRGRSCQAVFCPEHSVEINGQRLCRRHAGTVTAIGELAEDPNGRPDVDDRGPSLVNWISHEIDDNVRTLLTASRREGESLIVDEAVHMAHDQTRRARWERSWRVVESTGLILKVTIHVSENDDAMVHIRVGTEMVADGVPPWIARRREGQEVETSIDESQRQMFYRFLEENISTAVTHFRARGGKSLWGR